VDECKPCFEADPVAAVSAHMGKPEFLAYFQKLVAAGVISPSAS
jgi:hypothetical protein